MKLTKPSVFFSFLCLVGFSFFYACTNDEALEPTPCDIYGDVSFKDDIQPVLATYCYFPGTDQACHAAQGGSAPGAFEDYAGVQAKLNLFPKRVLQDKDMPPEYSTEGPTQMQTCDLELLRLWIEQGAQDN